MFSIGIIVCIVVMSIFKLSIYSKRRWAPSSSMANNQLLVTDISVFSDESPWKSNKGSRHLHILSNLNSYHCMHYIRIKSCVFLLVFLDICPREKPKEGKEIALFGWVRARTQLILINKRSIWAEIILKRCFLSSQHAEDIRVTPRWTISHPEPSEC